MFGWLALDKIAAQRGDGLHPRLREGLERLRSEQVAGQAGTNTPLQLISSQDGCLPDVGSSRALAPVQRRPPENIGDSPGSSVERMSLSTRPEGWA